MWREKWLRICSRNCWIRFAAPISKRRASAAPDEKWNGKIPRRYRRHTEILARKSTALDRSRQCLDELADTLHQFRRAAVLRYLIHHGTAHHNGVRASGNQFRLLRI